MPDKCLNSKDLKHFFFTQRCNVTNNLLLIVNRPLPFLPHHHQISFQKFVDVAVHDAFHIR